MERWPNFFIVGAPKSGTTSLYEYLKDVPGVYMSTVKEPNYFHTPNIFLGPRVIRTLDKSDYLKLFKDVTNEKAIGESSPGYLRDQNSPKLIYEQIPDARIIILLRNPVERTFSHYLMHKRTGVEKDSFHDVITRNITNLKNGIEQYNKCIDPSIYPEQVKRYLKTFGSNKVKILIFEEFIKNPKKIVKEVLDFLELEGEPTDAVETTHNVYGIPRGKMGKFLRGSITVKKLSLKLVPQSLRWKMRDKIALKKEEKPKLQQEDRLILESFFQDDVLKLQEMLGRELPWNIPTSNRGLPISNSD